MIDPIVTVRYQNLVSERLGRGFSKRELLAAGLTIRDALWIGVPVDSMRKSMHDENIETLIELMNETGVEEEANETMESAPVAMEAPTRKAAAVPKEDIGVALEDIPGVGPKTAERLREAGYLCAGDICKADMEELSQIKGISKKSAEDIIDKAKGL